MPGRVHRPQGLACGIAAIVRETEDTKGGALLAPPFFVWNPLLVIAGNPPINPRRFFLTFPWKYVYNVLKSAKKQTNLNREWIDPSIRSNRHRRIKQCAT